MDYSELCNVYFNLESNSSRLKKTEILSGFLKKIKDHKNKEIIYLLQGKSFPDYSEKEFGISEKLCIKALSKASGLQPKDIITRWKKLGDLGEVSENVISKKRQNTLFTSKLTIGKVLDNLKKLPELKGKGTIEKKLSLVSELLTSASPLEAKYIIRTLLNDLRIGVASGTIRDSIVQACFDHEHNDKEFLKKAQESVEGSYNKTNDFALVFEKSCAGISELDSTTLSPGHPLKVMLALKAESIADGFERVGSPAAFEYKYDGFRMLVNKDDSDEIKIFTRRLDDVTEQFPDVVAYIKDHIRADSFIIDAEAIGYDPRTKKYRPFEAVSQRIKRKHNIKQLIKQLPIEVNAFDILYLNKKSLLSEPFEKRTKLLRSIISPYKYKIRCSHQLITSDVKKAERFYKEALDDNQEGIMIKNLKSSYKPGARVGYMLKLKPAENELDLVITGAEYGKGKRVGIFSSFTLSCRDENNNLLEIGKAATGLKEKEDTGLSFAELTRMIKPLILREKGREAKIKPKIIVTITYQNIQRSPNYNSGFALRFPRITNLRHDSHINDIASLKEIEHDYKRHELKVHY